MKVRNRDTNELITAEQYRGGEDLPAGVYLGTDDDGIERAYISTKDPDGDVDLGDGTWILTSQDGEVALCSPVAFDAQYEEA